MSWKLYVVFVCWLLNPDITEIFPNTIQEARISIVKGGFWLSGVSGFEVLNLNSSKVDLPHYKIAWFLIA